MKTSSDHGSVVAVIPADMWADEPLRFLAIERAYDSAPQSASALGGVLAGPPELVVFGDVVMRWSMVRPMDGG